MKMIHTLSTFALLSMTVVSVAATAPSGYAGQELRDIKSLSSEEVQGLVSGKGMGLAKAAELNGYPGPLHVLELAAELGLTSAQLEQTQTLFNSMQAQAAVAGKALVEAERELDTLFATCSATPATLVAQLERVGALQARVRGVHLEAHLDQTRILSAEQVAKYATLRGYSNRNPSASHEHGHKH